MPSERRSLAVLLLGLLLYDHRSYGIRGGPLAGLFSVGQGSLAVHQKLLLDPFGISLEPLMHLTALR